MAARMPQRSPSPDNKAGAPRPGRSRADHGSLLRALHHDVGLSGHLVVAVERFWSVHRAVGLGLTAAGFATIAWLGFPFDAAAWRDAARGAFSVIGLAMALAGLPWALRGIHTLYVTAEGLEERRGWNPLRRRRRRVAPGEVLAVVVAEDDGQGAGSGGASGWAVGFIIDEGNATGTSGDRPPTSRQTWMATFTDREDAAIVADAAAAVLGGAGHVPPVVLHRRGTPRRVGPVAPKEP